MQCKLFYLLYCVFAMILNIISIVNKHTLHYNNHALACTRKVSKLDAKGPIKSLIKAL